MRIILSNTSGVPLYEQIVTQVRTAILTGALPEGTSLPSLRQLARDLQVSLITTTRAYNDLAAAGLVTNVPGKGSFVLPVDHAQVRSEAVRSLRDQLSLAVATAAAASIDLAAVHQFLDDAWQEANDRHDPSHD